MWLVVRGMGITPKGFLPLPDLGAPAFYAREYAGGVSLSFLGNAADSVLRTVCD